MRKILFVVALAAGAVAVLPPAAQAQATCNGLPVTIFGTEGDDSLVGTSGDDVFLTGGGNDTVFGVFGNDTACLGQGDDRFFGGQGDDIFVAEAGPDGNDLFHGGTGVDFAIYRARSTPVVVTMDGAADDGAAGEADNINNTVDFLIGGSANDTLTGNGLNNGIAGGPGNDTIRGGDGDDNLQGGPGDDLLVGGLGNDSLLGGTGNDRLSGQKGDDVVQGAGGDDTYLASNELDGKDLFLGGPGTDTADYSARQNQFRGALSLSPDGRANDGEADEDEVFPGIQRDNIGVDVENITGGNVIVGNIQNNVLIGGPGDDQIDGVDRVPGNDRIDGRFGIDRCTADPRDVVESCER